MQMSGWKQKIETLKYGHSPAVGTGLGLPIVTLNLYPYDFSASSDSLRSQDPQGCSPSSLWHEPVLSRVPFPEGIYLRSSVSLPTLSPSLHAILRDLACGHEALPAYVVVLAVVLDPGGASAADAEALPRE